MSPPSTYRSLRRRLADGLLRLFALADDPRDEDELRLRKRVGVAAGVLTIIAPLSVPLQAPGLPIAWVIGLALSAFSAGNLIVLAHTRNLERFVIALISAGVVFVPIAGFLGGGVTGPTTGLVWAFLVPAYAILAIGPRRATRWFVVYLAVVAVMVAIDPLARSWATPAPYALQVFGQIQNTVMPLAITFLLLRYTDIRRLAAEARADELLANAIPHAIATRLRHGERRIADLYPDTTVLFADLVGFTAWARHTPQDRVVEVLDGFFSALDEQTDRHRLEKIKTIGDAYMAVAGAPESRADHAAAALALGRAMIATVAGLRTGPGFDLDIRIGLASGPVVGGVIGQRRFLFDLWGDTVNLASRLESSGVPGRIQISAATRDLLGDDVELQPREIEVKGIGRLVAYLVGPAEPAPTTSRDADAR